MIAAIARGGSSASAVALLTLAFLAPLEGRTAEPAKETGASTMKSAPMKANGSGIIIRYRLDGTPKAGVPVPVVLSFDGVTDPAGALLRLETEGGLSLDRGAASQTLPAGAVTTLTINVIPAGAGIGYLHVFTTQHGAVSVTSVPVQVGGTPPAPPSAGELKQSPDGEKIRSIQVK